VLDVRTPAQYASGHLPAAQNISIEGAALEQMTAAGFTHVYNLAGGIGAWQTMGRPIATGG
jgi:rhodanese-related sulfurtransferase